MYASNADDDDDDNVHPRTMTIVADDGGDDDAYEGTKQTGCFWAIGTFAELSQIPNAGFALRSQWPAQPALTSPKTKFCYFMCGSSCARRYIVCQAFLGFWRCSNRFRGSYPASRPAEISVIREGLCPAETQNSSFTLCLQGMTLPSRT